MLTPHPLPADSPAELAAERERIFKAVAAAMPHCNPLLWQDWAEGFSVHMEPDDIIAVWLAAIASIQARPVEAWISVEDRLPPPCTMVLVYKNCRFSDRMVTTFINTRPSECVEDDMIAFWRHLPAAPTKDTP